MNYSKALRETIYRYNLKGAVIAQKAGISNAQLSEFKKGKCDINVRTLEQIVNALPSDAQIYFYQLLLRSLIYPRNAVGEDPTITSAQGLVLITELKLRDKNSVNL